MNKAIEQYYDEIEARLIQSPVILNYTILRKEILYSEGKIRIKIKLVNEDVLEIFEYVNEKDYKLFPKKYSYHWQDKFDKLKKRWDNAPHYRDLKNFPNHIHYADGSVEPCLTIPDIFMIISEIEEEFE
ncbi:MAG: hypothetical protein HY738_01750 [Bacteroidia bacterium]|nr:hypothetical protein [Bacteroidia bacterium]